MRRVKSALFLVVLFALILIIPSPVSRASKNAFAGLTEPLFQFSSQVFHGISQAGRFPEWFQDTKIREFRKAEFRRLALDFKELQAENQRLRELLNFKRRIARGVESIIPCRVIGRSPAGWRNIILVNKGSNDNIKVGAPIITPSGLVGSVSEVSPKTAKIRLVTDPQFRVGG